MRFIILMLLPIFGCANSPSSVNPLGLGAISINITNCASNEGKIRLAIYDSKDSFSKPNKHVVGRVVSAQKNTPLSVRIPNMAHGEYALAIYHDINDNGKLDKNMLGIPTEPYAFSNNPVIKWEPPTFDDARFTLTTSSQELNIELKYWKEY